MKAACLGLCFLVLATSAFPDTLPELLQAASSVNPVHSSMALDLELAGLRLEKSRIEARRERDRVTAELTFVSAQETARKALLAFATDVIDAVFDAAAAELDARSAALSESSAREDLAAAERQHERGLASEEDRANAAIALRSAGLALEQATWALEDAREALVAATGLEWRISLVPGASAFSLPAEAAAWLAVDLAVRRAELSQRVAALDVAALPANAAPYDRRIAEAALRKADAALSDARRSSQRAFREAARTLRSREATIAIRREELGLQQSLLADAERRYARGAIARGERDRQQIRVWSAEKARLQAVRSYLLAVVSAVVSLGGDPKEALR